MNVFEFENQVKNFPKIESPFKRITTQDKRYIVTNEVNPGYEWVLEDPEVLCTEKIDGTNVSIIIENSHLVGVFNRMNIVDMDVLSNDPKIEGVRHAFHRNHFNLAQNGQFYGECMGPNIQTNFLNLDRPLWFPFSKLRETYTYKSYQKYEKSFGTISRWFKDDIFSLTYRRLHKVKKQPEGVVFYQPSTGKMSKLRRSMFDWYKE